MVDLKKLWEKLKNKFERKYFDLKDNYCSEYMQEIEDLRGKLDKVMTENTVLKSKMEKLQQEDRIIIKKVRSKEIDKDELVERIRNKFSGVQIITLDEKYRVPKSKTKILEKLEDQEFKLRYYSNYFDCENYAFMEQSMMAFKHLCNSVGVVISYSSGHSFNIVVTRNEIFLYEPQSHKIVEGGTEMYKVDNQIIVI